MPYPLERLPTLGEFVERATRQYNATDLLSEVTVQGPRGEVRFRYLRRVIEGRVIVAPLPDLHDDDHLTPNMLRNLCVRLEITVQDFGLHLG